MTGKNYEIKLKTRQLKPLFNGNSLELGHIKTANQSILARHPKSQFPPLRYIPSLFNADNFKQCYYLRPANTIRFYVTKYAKQSQKMSVTITKGKN